jgi:hypothetical protein
VVLDTLHADGVPNSVAKTEFASIMQRGTETSAQSVRVSGSFTARKEHVMKKPRKDRRTDLTKVAPLVAVMLPLIANGQALVVTV